VTIMSNTTQQVSLFDTVKAYFMPFEISKGKAVFNAAFIPAFASRYMVRNVTVAALLYAFSGLAKQFSHDILFGALFAGACLFGALAGLFIAATLDTFR